MPIEPKQKEQAFFMYITASHQKCGIEKSICDLRFHYAGLHEKSELIHLAK
jgi:hypothetical protein